MTARTPENVSPLVGNTMPPQYSRFREKLPSPLTW
jgi:hypothetical protein